RTRLKSYQVVYNSSSPGISYKQYINRLVASWSQEVEVAKIYPTTFLFIHLKIENLSYQAVTISDFIFNKQFKFDKNCYFTNKSEPISVYFRSYFEEISNKKVKNSGFGEQVNFENESMIIPGTRIESKDVKEGVIAIEL